MKRIRNICIICLLFITLIIIANNQKSIHLGNKKTNIQGANKSVTAIQGKVFEANELMQEGPDGKHAERNTNYLQELINEASLTGGAIVKIPAGKYYFGVGEGNYRKNQEGRITESWAITCRNNVTIIGEGQDQTILKPYGAVTAPNRGGVDMFFFNDYALYNATNYLENANFKNFTIDGIEATAELYNSSGKGFMINLFKNCSWDNITVKNTSGTGFGIDCPINSSITNCTAEGCGKDGDENSYGASGFGIGTGFSEDESIYIYNCISNNNKKFGFFFEHQGKFNDDLTNIKYKAQKSQGFVISNCIASGNLYDFGGERAYDVTYENCSSVRSTSPDWDAYNRSALHFVDYSIRCHIVNFETEKKFNDVTDKKRYYYDAVYWAQKNGITEGSGREYNFYPEDSATKLQSVVFLYRLSELEGDAIIYGVQANTLNSQIITGFNDIVGSNQNSIAVKWAVDNDIITATSDKMFNPNNTVTRAEFITMLYNFAGRPTATGNNPFIDVLNTDYFKDAAIWAKNIGIVNGTDNSSFSPETKCTRAMVVTFLYRYLNSINTQENYRPVKQVSLTKNNNRSTTTNMFNITYNLLGGTLEQKNPIRYSLDSSDYVRLNNPTKKGYVFNGWTGSNIKSQGYTTTNYIPNKSVTINMNELGNKTYSANWTPISYSIKFDANGGTGEMQEELFTYDVPQILETNSFVKSCYEFKEWNTKPDGTGVSYQDGALINNDQQIVNDALDSLDYTVTLYAQWSLKRHYYNTTIVLPTCTQEGYTKYTCKECGDTYIDNKIPAIGHNLIEQEIHDSTCTENGYKIFKCKNCDYETNETIPAKGHSFENDVCIICGENNKYAIINIIFNNLDKDYRQLLEGKYNITIRNFKSLEYNGEYCTPYYDSSFTIRNKYLKEFQLKSVKFYGDEPIYITLQEVEAPEGYELLNDGKEIYIEIPKGEWPAIVDAPNKTRNTVSNKVVDAALFDEEEPIVVAINTFREKKQQTNEITLLSVDEPKTENVIEENTQIKGANNKNSIININFNNFDKDHHLLLEGKFNITMANFKSLEYNGKYYTLYNESSVTIRNKYLKEFQLKNVKFYGDEPIYITLQEVEAPEGYELLNDGKEIYIEIPKGEWPAVFDAPNKTRNAVSNKIVDATLFDDEEPFVVAINTFREKQQQTNEITLLSVDEPKTEIIIEENTQKSTNNTSTKTTTNSNTTAKKTTTSLFSRCISALGLNKYKLNNKTTTTTTPKQTTIVKQNNTASKTETKKEDVTQNSTATKTETKKENSIPKSSTIISSCMNILGINSSKTSNTKTSTTTKKNTVTNTISTINLWNTFNSIKLKLKK